MHQGSCGDSVAIWWASGCDGTYPQDQNLLLMTECVWLDCLNCMTYFFLKSLNFKILKTPSGGWTILVVTLASHIWMNSGTSRFRIILGFILLTSDQLQGTILHDGLIFMKQLADTWMITNFNNFGDAVISFFKLACFAPWCFVLKRVMRWIYSVIILNWCNLGIMLQCLCWTGPSSHCFWTFALASETQDACAFPNKHCLKDLDVVGDM